MPKKYLVDVCFDIISPIGFYDGGVCCSVN